MNAWCEAGSRVCVGRADHNHHKRMRSQGGGDELSNLLTVCAPCHRYIHAHPAESYKNGWLLRRAV